MPTTYGIYVMSSVDSSSERPVFEASMDLKLGSCRVQILAARFYEQALQAIHVGHE